MNDQINPYASPQVADAPELPARELAIRQLRGPSLGLLILAGLHLVSGTLNLISLPLMLLLSPGPSDRVNLLDLAPMAIATLIAPLQYFVFLGARRMRQRRELKFCRIMAVVSSIPFLSPYIFLGIPFGIWATVVLFREDVASQFDQPGE
jgi:hypothetical protein